MAVAASVTRPHSYAATRQRARSARAVRKLTFPSRMRASLHADLVARRSRAAFVPGLRGGGLAAPRWRPCSRAIHPRVPHSPHGARSARLAPPYASLVPTVVGLTHVWVTRWERPVCSDPSRRGRADAVEIVVLYPDGFSPAARRPCPCETAPVETGNTSTTCRHPFWRGMGGNRGGTRVRAHATPGRFDCARGLAGRPCGNQGSRGRGARARKAR